MRLRRDVSGHDLASALGKLGNEISRQSGGHLRLTTGVHGEHHVTVPAHKALRAGTLAAIIGDVSRHFEMSRDELLKRLFG